MKIIYIFELRHCYNYDENMFQFYVFKNAGYDVEVWSMVNWTFRDCPIPKNICTDSYVHYIDNESMLKKEMQRIRNENCYFLCYPYDSSYSGISFLIRKNIKLSSFSYSNISMTQPLANNIYMTGLIGHFIENLNNSIKKIIHPFYATCKALVSRCYRKKYVSMIKSDIAKLRGSWGNYPEFNFVPNQAARFNLPGLFDFYSKRNILLVSEAIDERNTMENEKRLIPEKYVVFIDQFVVGHSDLKKYGETIVFDAKAYYESMKNLFKEIESSFVCKVIIAAHPKAEYRGGEFGNRQIICNKTNLLIRDSEFVIFQFSTSLNLVTLLKKPFLNIYDRQFFRNPNTKNAYRRIKKFFNCQQLDISSPDEVTNFEKYLYPYTKKTYEKHNNEYVCLKSLLWTKKTFYELVLNKLKENGSI